MEHIIIALADDSLVSRAAVLGAPSGGVRVALDVLSTALDDDPERVARQRWVPVVHRVHHHDILFLLGPLPL